MLRNSSGAGTALASPGSPQLLQACFCLEAQQGASQSGNIQQTMLYIHCHAGRHGGIKVLPHLHLTCRVDFVSELPKQCVRPLQLSKLLLTCYQHVWLAFFRCFLTEASSAGLCKDCKLLECMSAKVTSSCPRSQLQVSYTCQLGAVLNIFSTGLLYRKTKSAC